MKHLLLLLVVCLIVSAAVGDGLLAQITSGNGYLGYSINQYGRVRVDLYPYTSRQVDRFTAIAAVDTDLVFDYTDNSENVSGPTAVTVPGVDDAIELMTDGSWADPLGQSAIFVKLRVGYLLMTWTDMPYLVVRLRFYNDSSAAMTYYLWAITLPRVSGLYGGETIVWDATTETAYYYRTGETPHWGFRLLRRPTYSVKMLDWDVYSPDPDNDVSTDSIRYQMTAGTGFDATLTAGANGSIFNVNRGRVTIASGDSTDIEYVIAYGGSPAEVIAACDSGQTRYEKFLTSVPTRQGEAVPSRMTLHQNYPNPFNPETEIRFDVVREASVTLRIYNLVGQEVSTLVREQLSPGSYSVRFSGIGLPSGTYYYRLEAGEFRSTKTMILLK